MVPIPLDDSLWHGHVSLERGEGWVRAWRLPHTQLRLFPPDDALPPRAEHGAGVRLRFQTDASSLTLTVAPGGEARLFDLAAGRDLLQTARLAPGEQEAQFDLPGAGVYQVWLPQSQATTVRGLQVPDGALFEPAPSPRPRWVHYGSSISQCATAHSPTRAWPAVVARRRDLNLTCLGFGGNCHLDPMVARTIRDLPADLITLKLGINVQGGASLSGRTVMPAVIGLVQTIRDAHPDTPIAVISPIISPPREDQPNAVGMSLQVMRDQVAEAVQRLKDMGDANLYYHDGRAFFGAEHVRYLPDLLHPNGDGYEILGHNIAERLFGAAPFDL